MIKGFKYIFTVFIIIIIVISIGSHKNIKHLYTAKIQLYEEYIVDEAGLKARLNINSGHPFTGFIQLKGFDEFETIGKEFKMDFSMVDFDESNTDNYLAISFGRKIEGITYQYLGYPHKKRTIAHADVVFSEQYEEHKMYVYLMDKILFMDAFIEGNSYYIMNGADKIYLGNVIDDLNK